MANPALIIAEAEINHNGEVELAQKLVSAAAEAGADMVKFQCFVPEKFIAPGSSYISTFQDVALSLDEFHKIRRHAERTGIRMISTAGDLEGLKMIDQLDLEAVKIGSTNITNIGLLRAIAETKRPVYLSTGASTLGEIETALDILGVNEAEISLFHCTVQYPADPANLNLNVLCTLAAAFPDMTIGYSDHTVGTTAAVAARALGAVMFEKHFTLDHELPGPDHSFSADPEEFAAYVAAIREAETMLGHGKKEPAACEVSARQAGRRYMTAMTDISDGAFIAPEMIRPRRIELGADVSADLLLGPDFQDRLIGSKSRQAISAGEPLFLNQFDFER